MHHLHDKSELPTHGTLVTAGTDGTIALWGFDDQRLQHAKEPGNLRLIHHTRVHQNTIKCLKVTCVAVRPDGSTTYLIMTGGDDNGLALTRLETSKTSRDSSIGDDSESDNITASTTILSIPRAHSAAITALVWMPIPSSRMIKEQGSPFLWQSKVVTASNDQRVKMWDVNIDLTKQGVDGITVKRGGNVPTPVADVGSMDVLPDENPETANNNASLRELVVCGVGMDIWRM